MNTDGGPAVQTDGDGVDLADGVDHQVVMVMDLNKCIGCQTCMATCKSFWTEGDDRDYTHWNDVETKPGKGYPCDRGDSSGDWAGAEHIERSPGDIPDQVDYGDAWLFNHEEVTYNGSDQPLRPDNDPEWGSNWDKDQGAGEYPSSYYFYLPCICNHCTHSSCVEVCPRKAIYKREGDGTVFIDQERCRDYRYYVEGRPYKRAYYNATQRISGKRIFCYSRIEGEGPDGETFTPVCAEDYPPQLRLAGSPGDEQGLIHKLAEEYEVALPLHLEYQMQPNVHYIPSFAPPQHSEDGETVGMDRVPRNYLEELFGDHARDALDTIEKECDKVNRSGGSELLGMLTDTNSARRYRLEALD